jgi:PBP1b-binding outer membrane lipoprotein LpoB
MPDKKDFVIKDKRMFAEEDPEKQDQEAKEESAKPSKEEVKASESQEASAPEEDTTDFQLPKINFATFIFSLNSSVLAQLGLIDDPVTGKKTKHLPLAKQTIDILGMLEEKTRGNLTKDEETMLKNILYDLRMIYVKEKG